VELLGHDANAVFSALKHCWHFSVQLAHFAVHTLPVSHNFEQEQSSFQMMMAQLHFPLSGLSQKSVELGLKMPEICKKH
jgi:hypothetical protein